MASSRGVAYTMGRSLVTGDMENSGLPFLIVRGYSAISYGLLLLLEAQAGCMV